MRAVRAALAALLLGLGLTLGRGAAGPEVALACSCIAPQPLAQYAGESNVIFSGTVAGDDDEGVVVDVEHWFSGTGVARIVVIGGDFGNGSSCGVGSRPAVGSSWIWVAWRPPDEDLSDLLDTTVQINICSPFAELSTPEGAALLEEAMATFGGGEKLPAGVESPGVAATPVTAASPGGIGAPAATAAIAAPSATPVAEAGVSKETVAFGAVAGIMVLGVAVLGIVLLVGQRGRRPGGQPPG